jgi:hypothetical protein
MKLLDEHIRQLLDQGMAALWLPADSDEHVVRAAISLPWKAIWSALEPDRLRAMLAASGHSDHRIVQSKEEGQPPGVNSGVVVVYDVSQATRGSPADKLRKRRRAEELENEIEGWSGLLVRAEPADLSDSWLAFVEALAPTATVILDSPTTNWSSPTTVLAPVVWSAGLLDFFHQAADHLRELGRQNVVDLKDAPGVEIDSSKIESLGDAWELLRRAHTAQQRSVGQEEFDAFLSGDLAWKAISAGAAYERGPICRFLPHSDGERERKLDAIAYAREKIKNLDREETDPFDPVEQVMIFAEAGSGCSTLLRQIALAIARDGYPTLITTPYPRQLSPESLGNAVIYLQDTWAEARRGRGSGAGNLPVCLVLDVDAELPARFAKFMRSLSGELHRKVLIVRALRRSEAEIENSRGVLRLFGRTDETEILALGRHLREFCSGHKLLSIPSDSEWRVFYESFGRLRSHHERQLGSEIETPPLFLIGLHPFIKERVRDERSLEQYLYRRWDQIEDAGARQLVEILAAAGAHNIAVPFESLMRNQSLESALFSRLERDDQRLLDFFCRWITFGWQRRNWALCIRHPGFGILLTRLLHPAEASTPYTPLVPVLRDLTGTEADRWFAEQIAYIFGRRFQRESGAFSLEFDTAMQRAARVVFDSIPEELHNSSRTICHHHARFYIHLLHACLSAIANPSSTRLPQDAVSELINQALSNATRLLEKARSIPDDREKVSNVLNTLAASIARLAESYAQRGAPDQARIYFRDAVERANEAVASDAANGHALFNVVNTILLRFESDLVGEPREAGELFELAEDRLETLVQLLDNRQWRNTDDVEAELSVGWLVQRMGDLAHKLGTDARMTSLRAPSNVASVLLQVRSTLGADSLRKAFSDPGRTEVLRNLRETLRGIEQKSTRGLLLLYKLYLNDPLGRLDFATRLDLLSQIERQSSEEYDPYRHDHAALFCQTGFFEAGARMFRELYAAREAQSDRWFWINERLLLEVSNGIPKPKRYVVRVTDARMGWASLENTGIRVKIQPRQFGDLVVGQYVPVYIRFRLGGLQAVDERMARFDFEAMGYHWDS